MDHNDGIVVRHWRFFVFVARLALHMAPGYIKTAPHRLTGAKITIQASVYLPMYNGTTQRLHGTFRELVSEVRDRA